MCNCNKDFRIVYLGEDLVVNNKHNVTEEIPLEIDLSGYFLDPLTMPDSEVVVELFNSSNQEIVKYTLSLLSGNFFLQENNEAPVSNPDAKFTFTPDHSKLDYGEEHNLKLTYTQASEVCNYVLTFERLFDISEEDCGIVKIDIPEEGNIDVSTLSVEVYDIDGTVLDSFNYFDKNTFAVSNNYISFKVTNGTYVKYYNELSLCKITKCYINNITDHFCDECFEPCKDDCDDSENELRRYKLNRLNSIMFSAMNYAMFFNDTYRYLDLYSVPSDYNLKYETFNELADLVIKCTSCDDSITNPVDDCKPCKDC